MKYDVEEFIKELLESDAFAVFVVAYVVEKRGPITEKIVKKACQQVISRIATNFDLMAAIERQYVWPSIKDGKVVYGLTARGKKVAQRKVKEHSNV
jgi:hypothetical protein